MSAHYSFIGGAEGPWEVIRCETITGAPLECVPRLNIINQPAARIVHHGTWVLQGFTSNIRYAERHEIRQLQARQEGLDRPESRCAALIPIRKSPAWWAMSQDERRAVFETESHHTEIGLAYLPAIARQLHHSRDLGEPFDFLTWFEFSYAHADAFDALLAQLRASREWTYVEREIDIRLVKAA